MKMSLGRIGGMLVLGLCLSAGRAWASGDAAGGQTRVDDKIKDLAEVIAVHGHRTEQCAHGDMTIGKDDGQWEVSCVSRVNDADGFLFNAAELRHSKFVFLFDPGAGISSAIIVYEPLVPKNAKTVEDLRKAGAIVEEAELREGIEKAHPIRAEARARGRRTESCGNCRSLQAES